MPTIAVTIIKKPRKYRRCDECGKSLDGETIRLYGMAHHGEKPYNLYLHRSCIYDADTLGKIRAAELPDAPACGDGQIDAQDDKATTEIVAGKKSTADTARHSAHG